MCHQGINNKYLYVATWHVIMSWMECQALQFHFNSSRMREEMTKTQTRLLNPRSVTED
jgi:hypothetical protein